VGLPVRAAGQAAEHHRHLLRVGPRGENALLRALELRRGHHLHGLGDLLRVLDGANLAPQAL